MAHEYTTWVYQQDIRGAGRKFVLIALADIADDRGYAFPGQKRLTRMTGQSERSVREHLEWLEENGYLRREQRRRSDGTRTSDAYYLPEKDATGNIRRWATTGKTRRLTEQRINPDQDSDSTDSTTGNIRRLSTGNSRRTNRQISPKSPAESAGHEPSVEPPVEPSPPPPTPSTPPQEEAEEGSGLEDLTPYQQRQLNRPPGNLTGSQLATHHPAVWKELANFRRLHSKPVPDAQFVTWASAALDDAREHGDHLVTAALNITNANFASLATPWNYYRGCIRKAATEANTAQRHANNPTGETITQADIDRIFELAKEGALT